MNERPFTKPSNIFESQIGEIFKKDSSEIDSLISIISILMFKNVRDKTLLTLFKATDIELFTKILLLFEGRTINFPSKDNIEEIFILGTCYYYKEVEGLSWEEIKKILPFEIRPTTYGIKINNLTALMKRKLEEIVEDMK